MDTQRWIEHFRRHQENRPVPHWTAPVILSPDVLKPLIRSIEQFQLGDGGGPGYLIAGDRERYLTDGEGIRQIVDLWFAEEHEHSRLLLGLVNRFGGTPIKAHWSFGAFCWTRKVLGVGFELTTLLVTEVSSTAYNRLLRKHTRDEAVKDVCGLILRDEAGHVAFHAARLADAAHWKGRQFGSWWALWFRFVLSGAATMLWVNHAAALRAVGGTRKEFYGEVRREFVRFHRLVERELERCGDVRPAKAA